MGLAYAAIAAWVMVFVLSCVAFGATATVDANYPAFTSGPSAPDDLYGVGFTRSADGATPTASSISGSITGEAGVPKTGGANAWEKQQWRGTITGATAPKWDITLEGKVKADVAVANSTPSLSTGYKCTATGEIYFEGANDAPAAAFTSSVKGKAKIQKETAEAHWYGQFTSTPNADPAAIYPNVEQSLSWTKDGSTVEFFVSVKTSGEISTDRGEVICRADALLDIAISGKATAYDGTTEVQRYDIQ